jgi:hypothetical protein
MGVFRNIKATGELAQVQDDCAKLKRDFQALELEWSNMYDKLRRMMQRIAKRAEIAEKLQESNENEPQELDLPSAGHAGILSPAQRRVQQAILRERAGLG